MRTSTATAVDLAEEASVDSHNSVAVEASTADLDALAFAAELDLDLGAGRVPRPEHQPGGGTVGPGVPPSGVSSGSCQPPPSAR